MINFTRIYKNTNFERILFFNFKPREMNMLKRIMAFCLLLNVFVAQANVGTQNTLKAAFDEINYSLSVDWDQQDKAFYNEQMKKFQAQIEELQAKGLSNGELITFAQAQLKNETIAKDLELAFTLIQLNKLSDKEARKLVLETIGKSHGQGASWAGDVAIIAAASLLLILVVAIAISSPTSGGSYNNNYCYDDYVCYDYYDYWGFYWYSDCYYQTYCY